MIKHISNETFYKHLTDDTKKRVKNFNKQANIYNYIKILSIISFCIVSFIFIYAFRGIFFFKRGIYTTSAMIHYTEHLIIFSLIVYSIGQISKLFENNLHKSSALFKSYLLRDLCSCSDKCNCRNSLINFYKNNGYDITK